MRGGKKAVIKWENINLLIIIIYLFYKVINFEQYTNKIDVLIHYLLINLLFMFVYRFYYIIKDAIKKEN